MNVQRKGASSLNKCAYQVSLSHCKRKLPPFAKRLLERSKPITNDIFLVIGAYTAYLKAKSFWYGENVALTYHPDSQPNEFDWGVVKNQSVLIFDLTTGITASHCKMLALELLNHGALVVRYITPDYSIVEFKGVGYVH